MDDYQQANYCWGEPGWLSLLATLASLAISGHYSGC